MRQMFVVCALTYTCMKYVLVWLVMLVVLVPPNGWLHFEWWRRRRHARNWLVRRRLCRRANIHACRSNYAPAAWAASTAHGNTFWQLRISRKRFFQTRMLQTLAFSTHEFMIHLSARFTKLIARPFIRVHCDPRGVCAYIRIYTCESSSEICERKPQNESGPWTMPFYYTRSTLAIYILCME